MEKKQGRQKKLGLAIVAIAVGVIFITVLLSMILTMTMFRQFTNIILVERANVGVSVLEEMLRKEIQQLNDDYWMWSQDMPFADAINSGDPEYFTETWSEYKNSESSFCAVVGNDGNVIFSEGFPYSNFDYRSVLNGNIKDGVYLQDGKLTALYAARVTENDAEGALILGFSLEKQGWLDNVKKMTECDVTIFNGNIRYATTLGSSLLGTAMGDNIKKQVIDSKTKFTGQATINDKLYYVAYTPMYDMNNNIAGAFFAGSDATTVNSQFSNVAIFAALTALVLAAVGALVMFLFTRKRVIEPIKQVSVLADEMERGDLRDTKVDYWFENDEVGSFARKLRYSKKSVSACIDDISGILAAMADGDFTNVPQVDYPGDFESIKVNLHKIESDLGETLNKMNISSDEVLTGSNQMAEGSQSLADGTTKQASAIEEISATINEVSTQISGTAENAAKAGDLSRRTEEKVNYQDEEIQKMVEAMNGISETSKQIEKIIKTIEDISFQTNILALNAAVEAARAGDAGKGFAVVADEVRNLASKSADAAKSTTTLINAAIEAVDKGAAIAHSTEESMKEVKQMTEETAALIVKIADASQEQNQSIRQITAGVEQIAQVIQTNSATAQETAASCEELSGQSRLLKDQVARFRINQ